MRLTPRDHLLFSALSQYRFLSTKQIEEKLFSALERTTVMRRLRKLESQKYIRRIGRLPGGMHVWGNQNAWSLALGYLPSPGRVNLHTLPHDVLMNDVRTVFEEIGAVKEWFDTRHIEMDSLPGDLSRDFKSTRRNSGPYIDRVIPDGLFVGPFGKETKNYAIELELNRKSRPRYEDLLDRYMHRQSIPHPWFIVPDLRLGKFLISRSGGHVEGRKYIMVTLLQDLLANRQAAKIYTSSGREIIVSQIVNCKDPDTSS